MTKVGDVIPKSAPHLKVEWPNGARLAVLLTFDYQAEEGAPTLPDGRPNYQEITERSYGGRYGIWRILDILDKHNIKASFMTCGATAENYPESVQEIVKRGHELGAHTYHHEDIWKLNKDEEREVFEKTINALVKVSGQRPVAWRSPKVRCSDNTLDLLAEYGFVWHSDFLNDDYPYILDINGKKIVEVPYTFSTDDAPLYNNPSMYPYGIPRNVLTVWKDEFHQLYEESKRTPKMMIICCHPYVTGRPSRARVYDEFLTYLEGFPGLWFARGIDMANWWLEHGQR